MKVKLPAQIMFFMIFSLIVYSCKDSDSDLVNNTLINFRVTNDSINASSDSLLVQVELDQKAPVDGQIRILLSGNAAHAIDFSTKPAAVNGIITLDLPKETQKAEFTIFRSTGLSAERTIALALETSSRGFITGEKSAAFVKLHKTLTVTDSINFSDVFIHISENEPQGYEVGLTLKGSLTQPEQAVIEIVNPSGIEYGTSYTTTPAAVQNELKLDITPGTKNLSFKILPVNDSKVKGNYELLFRIKSTTGHLVNGSIHEVTVRVEEDDKQQADVHSIADLKKIFGEHEGEFWIPKDYFIEGIITSGSNVIDEKTAYIQDSTGGIMLRFTIKNKLQLGDKVRLNLKNASGNIVNDQKAIFNISDMSGTKLGEKLSVMPVVITLQQLASGNYKGTRVKINDVRFSQANGVLTFEGNRQIVNGSASAAVTTYATATFKNSIVPEGLFSVTGIAGDWGRILPQLYTDIFKIGN